MADDSVKTVCGTFATREEAERAVEHLVQEHGINPADVFVRAQGQRNSAGTETSGADLKDRRTVSRRLSIALPGKRILDRHYCSACPACFQQLQIRPASYSILPHPYARRDRSMIPHARQ